MFAQVHNRLYLVKAGTGGRPLRVMLAEVRAALQLAETGTVVQEEKLRMIRRLYAALSGLHFASPDGAIDADLAQVIHCSLLLWSLGVDLPSSAEQHPQVLPFLNTYHTAAIELDHALRV